MFIASPFQSRLCGADLLDFVNGADPVSDDGKIGVLPDLAAVHEKNELARDGRQIAQNIVTMIQVETPERRVHENGPRGATGPVQPVNERQCHNLLRASAAHGDVTPGRVNNL